MRACPGDDEASPLKVADGKTDSVSIDKVSGCSVTVGSRMHIVLFVDKLAVIDQQSCGNPVAEGLGL